MLGASALKILKYFKEYGFGFTTNELVILLTGMGFGLAAGVLVTFVAAKAVVDRQEEQEFC